LVNGLYVIEAVGLRQFRGVEASEKEAGKEEERFILR